jgi:hypothetical protein
MGELNSGEEPKFIKTVEEILYGLVHFLLYFPVISLKVLFRPKQVFEKNLAVKPLTYFTVCLLLSSTFWSTLFEPTRGLIDTIIFYIDRPDFSEIKKYFFESDSLIHTLVSLIPIILISIVSIELLRLIFRVKDKAKLIRFYFYLSGQVFFLIPLILMLPFFIKSLTIDKYADYFRSDAVFVISILTLFILLIRVIWVSAVFFCGNNNKFWFLKSTLFSLMIICCCCYSTTLPSFFYTPPKNKGIEGNIYGVSSTKLSDTSKTFTVKINVLITNRSETDQPIWFNSMWLEIVSKKQLPIYSISAASIGEIKCVTEPIKETSILKNHAAIYLEIPFHFSNSDRRKIATLLTDDSIYSQSFHEKSINLLLTVPGGSEYKIITTRYLDIDQSDFKKSSPTL